MMVDEALSIYGNDFVRDALADVEVDRGGVALDGRRRTLGCLRRLGSEARRQEYRLVHARAVVDILPYLVTLHVVVANAL
jgi:hypothetical protein